MESRGVTRSATFGLADIPPGALVEVAETDFGQVRQEAERAATRAIVLRIFAPLFFSRRCTCTVNTGLIETVSYRNATRIFQILG